MLRRFYLEKILTSFSVNPICAILGPRQVGKTTLARQFAKEYNNQKVEFFDLEYEPDLARLENPTLTLQHNVSNTGKNNGMRVISNSRFEFTFVDLIKTQC